MREGILIARQRPRKYPATETQIGIKEAAEFCGIRKGITRKELRIAMRDCIPQYWRDKKAQKRETGN